MRVILAEPRGFCAGVERAIQIVELALKKYGPPVYVRHEIVHNRRVVEELRQKGARFVDQLHEVPDGAITIFSAHGVAEKVQAEAEQRSLPVIDATCPLVAKVHMEGQRYAGQRRDVILIGHRGHPEVEGTLGRVNGPVHLVSTVEDVARLRVTDESRVAYVTQTTLSVDDTRTIIEALTARFPKIVGPDVKDICYATQNRQHAVRLLARQVQLLIVVGSQNSSNSNRLREIGADCGVPSYLVDTVEAIEPRWFEGVSVVGVSAGASAPEGLVQEVVRRLNEITPVAIERLQGIAENVRFKLPRELASLASAAD